MENLPKIRHVGFTGTKEGMSEHQKNTLRQLMIGASLDGWKNILHHGDCKGADAEAHDIALELGWEIVIHPPIKRIFRAYKQGAKMIMPPADYLVRNHDIVDASRVLFATPKTDKEELRSGTWATVRYAHKTGKRVILLSREEQSATAS